MATSVKMDERTKSRLEELQALVKLATGRKVSQQELLDRLVEQAYDSREAFVESFEEDDEWEGLGEEEIERWLSGTISSGSSIEEEDIDEVLYGRTDESGTDRVE
jgi:hypothetical protein